MAIKQALLSGPSLDLSWRLLDCYIIGLPQEGQAFAPDTPCISPYGAVSALIFLGVVQGKPH